MVDAMSIKKYTSWDGSQFRGFVDLGDGFEADDEGPLAKEALVFMVVSQNSNWKVPCGYVFINGLNGCELANLVKVCIEKLHDVGADVTTLTSDGPACNFAMMHHLGANLKLESLDTSFPNPADPQKKVYVILDACHMLKLVRNCLGAVGYLLDENGNKIEWRFIVELQKLQEKEGVHLANKLRASHIRYESQKMKVKLAAQTLSSSVADAIEYCDKTLKLKQFKNSEATVKFIRLINDVFDVLNSRNPLGRGLKAPLSIKNKSEWEPFLEAAFNSLSSIKTLEGKSIFKTKKKTGFLGLLIDIASIRRLFHELVESNNAPLKYLLTYKVVFKIRVLYILV